MSLRRDLDAALGKLREADELLSAARTVQRQGLELHSNGLREAVETGLNALEPEAVPITDHRRHHRPGPPPRIDSDPELQAFIRARIDRLTFIQISEAVKEAFPPERRVGKSSIHAWWSRNAPTGSAVQSSPTSPGGPG